MERKTILLVEDNKDGIDLTLRAFRRLEIATRVDVVRDGEEALAYLLGTHGEEEIKPHEPPSIVLLDLNLPKVGGLDVLKRIRSEERTRAVPVVVLSTSGAPADVLESYRIGVNSYVQKPVDFIAFIDVLRNLCRYWITINMTPGGPN